MRCLRAIPLAVLSLTMVRALPAQTSLTYEQHMALGDSLTDALMPAEALEHFRAAYLSNQSYDAMWRFARAQIDVAKQLDDDQRKLRDSLYGVAHLYAAAAVRADSLGVDGHFMFANALGRLSRTKGGKERVRFAKQIYEAAAKALELDPTHDGAEHVIGAWHAEVMRLSGLAKFFAKTFLGGGFLGLASWDSAVVHLEEAIRLKPEYLYHHLELAQVHIDLGRSAEARRELEEVLRLPPTSDVSDPEYQAEARRLLVEIRDQR